MRIHSNVIVPLDILDAAKYASNNDVAGDVYVRPITMHGSRSHSTGYEMALIGDGSVKRHRTMDKQDFSATYDSWGYALAYLFSIDPDMKAGTYKNKDHFLSVTSSAYPIPPARATRPLAAV